MVGPMNLNICARPDCPSGGVEKLALSTLGVVLSFGEHSVVAKAHAAEIRLLEVTGCFVEAQEIEFVVIPVGDVEELGNHAAPELINGECAVVAVAGRRLTSLRIARPAAAAGNWFESRVARCRESRGSEC